MVFDVFDYVWTIVVVTKDNASVVKRTNEQIVESLYNVLM